MYLGLGKTLEMSELTYFNHFQHYYYLLLSLTTKHFKSYMWSGIAKTRLVPKVFADFACYFRLRLRSRDITV